MTLHQRFAANLKKQMDAKGLSRVGLAAQCGVGINTVHLIFSPTRSQSPTLTMLERLARGLGIDPHELVKP